MTKVTTFSATRIVEYILGQEWQPDKQYHTEFPIRCLAIVSRPSRDDYFELFRDVGKPNIDKALYNRPGLAPKPGSVLVFVFPERHMSVGEQRNFISTLHKHSESDNIERVDLVTSSPIILSDLFANQIMTVLWPEDDDRYPLR